MTTESPVRTSDRSTAEVTKDQAAAVGGTASDAGQQVAAVAKEQAHSVAAEAGGQAKDLLHQTRSELTKQAADQQQRLAAGLRSLGDELHAMSQHDQQAGAATGLAKQASSKSHDAASWLESREPGHAVEELKSFAQRRPGAFLAAAVGVGLLAGRLSRGVKDASTDESTPAGAHAQADGYRAADLAPQPDGYRSADVAPQAGVESPVLPTTFITSAPGVPVSGMADLASEYRNLDQGL